MAWRMVKVLLYMVRCMMGYIFHGKDPVRRKAYLVQCYLGWARFCLKTYGVNLEVQGSGYLPPEEIRPLVILCNHQSQLDIPALVAGMGRVMGFVAKRELSRVPILAFWMREIGCVFINRTDRRSATQSMEAAAATLRQEGHMPLVVFPEGTRSKTGSLLPLKMGGLRMAVLAGAVVVPTHIRNSRNAVEARNPGSREPIPVRLRFFAPVDTRGWSDEKASWAKLREYLERCWAEGEAEGDSPVEEFRRVTGDG
jgi:1-acyl-sn-glycerol-3-phosphate acyltransferase